VNPTTSFQLAPYSIGTAQNKNVALLTSNTTTVTMTLATPAKYTAAQRASLLLDKR